MNPRLECKINKQKFRRKHGKLKKKSTQREGLFKIYPIRNI